MIESQLAQVLQDGNTTDTADDTEEFDDESREGKESKPLSQYVFKLIYEIQDAILQYNLVKGGGDIVPHITWPALRGNFCEGARCQSMLMNAESMLKLGIYIFNTME